MRFKSKRQETFIFVQAISVDYFSKTTLFLTQKLMEKWGKYSIPLQKVSVPFHVLFSLHTRTAEPLSTNPRLHLNFTMSPLL